ncbi:malonyl CoA-acyl carrier protein transacylase [Lachnotalea glycerini]|uniref:[acyl-carrier-protein] S-malonyltransferase n=1 Tax=Lachnotalea glycerini TaxID=1763509 RepID=A0A318ERH8_9FIRM|nr:ACP S-malonyltransferase [Lachnotalea glycerini]PXV95579.1 malonyl CoA-acyl carrier protein transacylase [Lachnotalea glycerini]
MENWNGYGIGFPPREVVQKGLNIEFYEQFDSFRKLYEEASYLFKFDFYKASFKRAQVIEQQMLCLLLYCHGITKILTEQIGLPKFTLGYSQGEFAAITESSGMDFFVTMDLVYRLEKIIMQNQEKLTGKMCRVVDFSYERLQELCKRVDPVGNEVSIAIHISDRQNIIAGKQDKVDSVCNMAKQESAHFIIPTGDSVYHCLMCSDIQKMAKHEFDSHKFQNSDIDVFSCFTGESTRLADIIKRNISNQIVNMIQWKRLCDNVYKTGVRHIVEIGAGTTVSGNMRLNYPQLKYSWINSPGDLEEVVKTYKAITENKKKEI